MLLVKLIVVYAITLILVSTLASFHVIKGNLYYDFARYMLMGQSLIVCGAAVYGFFIAKDKFDHVQALPPALSFMMFHLFVLGACAALIPDKEKPT